MAFYCEPCCDLMTPPPWSLSFSRGPCECCGKTRVCLDVRGDYVWSEKNRELAALARLEREEQKKQKNVVDTPGNTG